MHDPTTTYHASASTPPAEAGERRFGGMVAGVARRSAKAVAIGAAVFAVIVAVNVVSVPPLLRQNLVPLAILAVTGAAVVRWRRAGFRRSLRSGFAAKTTEYGGGIYGAVAAATWVWLETSDILGDIVAAGSLWAWVGGMSIPWLIGEVVDAVRFAITAAFWPWYWLGELGAVPVFVFAAGVWTLDLGLRRLARRFGWGGSVLAPEPADG